MKFLLLLEAITGSLEVASAFKAVIDKMVAEGRTDVTEEELTELVAARRALENEVHS